LFSLFIEPADPDGKLKKNRDGAAARQRFYMQEAFRCHFFTATRLAAEDVFQKTI
jgi:hypothetical protein